MLGLIGEFGRTANWVTSLGGRAPGVLTRFLRYAASSSSMVLLDLIILGFLTEILEFYYLASVVVSFTTSNSVNYFINRKWGFKDTKTKMTKGYFFFLGFGIFGLSLTVLLMWLFVSVIGVHYLFSRIIVAVIEGTLGFILNSIFTFRVPIMGITREFGEKRKDYVVLRAS